MSYFEKLRESESSFYRALWDDLKDIKVIDTHEHFDTIEAWIEKSQNNNKKDPKITIPQIFERSYIHIKEDGNYKQWAKELGQHRGTGYLRAWLIAMEDLYGLEAQTITPKYLESMESLIIHAYAEDFDNKTYNHLEKVLKNNMKVEKAILNVGLDLHKDHPQPICQAAAGIPSILEGIQVPRNINMAKGNVVFWYAMEKMDTNLEDIKTLDDYCDITIKLLEYLRESNDYVCIKMQMAYNRPLWFPEPPDDESEIARLFNKPPDNEKQLWKFGDYMMHFVLEWTSLYWRVPYQLHTGLARMFDGGSNALNLSHLFQKFPDVHFDLFHGNYPYNNLGGMLHQIPNISADLCWLPAISPTAAQRTLTELFEVGDMVSAWPYHVPSMRTCLYGGDSGIVEGSYGALQIAKDVLIRSLEDLYERGHILKTDAFDLAKRVLYDNPKRIFQI
ncbi:MAG: hypothetical protein GF364_10645 [Candidatus Lokiarchaeota archaeon]|nr:hypothetical protein [Candidatus Lokiarchaeota archaeon]